MKIINKNLYKKMQLGILIIIISILFIGCGDDNNEESFWNKEIYDNEDTQPQDVTDDVLGDRNGGSDNVGGGKYVEEEPDDSTTKETQQMTDMVQNEEYQVAYRGYTLEDAPYADLIDKSPYISYKDLLRYEDKYMNQWIKMKGSIEVYANGVVAFKVLENEYETNPTYVRAAYLNYANAEIIGNSYYSGLTEINEIDCLNDTECTVLGTLNKESDASNVLGVAVLYFIFD